MSEARPSTMNELFASLVERGARIAEWAGVGAGVDRPIADLCDDLLSSRGEASGIALASEILARYETMSAADRLAFFESLRTRYDPDVEKLRIAAETYVARRDATALSRLLAAAEPPRQELFRRLNMAPGGTRRLVRLRADLLSVLAGRRELAAIDDDLRHLFASWFNRGFLELRRIDWRSPAVVLEKIIAYEAVHQIDSWDELRRRTEPSDRRCFAFFHPAMPDEPLVFVEVALTAEIASSIQAVLAPERTPQPAARQNTAMFYSISNCQAGLTGVSFGAFLIKQVASDLSRELPNLKQFVTLSPVPGFVAWLEERAGAEPEGAAAAALARVRAPGWLEGAAALEAAREPLLGLAARYFLEAKRLDGQPIDPVARFHLGNGAALDRLHWLGDVSPRGLARSAGLMVSYRYDLDAIEARHEAYAASRAIAVAKGVRALASAGDRKNRRGDG